MGLPTISVTFTELAQSLTARAARGRLAIIIQDATDTSFNYKTYARLSEVDEDDYTEANYAVIKRAFLAKPYQVIVVRVGTSGTLADATAILEDLTYHWVCTPVSGFQSSLATYIKSRNTETATRHTKCVVTGVSSADDMHVVNVANTSVTEANEDSTTDMAAYISRIAGVLAACPLSGSVTYAELDDLTAVTAVADPGTSIDAGNLVLIKDDDAIRIARGVNTLQTIASGMTADMKKIAVVEALDLIREDIILTFKQHYMGVVRNSPDNQALFISDVNEYFKELSDEQILNPEETNEAWIDVAAMRSAWTNAGSDVSDLTDAEVRNKPYSSYIYVAAQIRVLDAMEDLVMVITLA